MVNTIDVERALPDSTEKQSNPIYDDINHTSSHKPYTLEEEEIARIPTHTSRRSRSKITPAGLVKTLTEPSNANLIHPGPPPDGGSKAWTQACMGHLVVFNTWGLIASFGVFQAYYTTNLNLEPSAVSWIGSIQMLGHFSLGMFTGRLFDAGYFYHSLIPGVLVASLGMFMTSLCTQYYQLFLAQGLMIGIGCGMQFAPCLSLLSTYFAKNRSVALAIMASGSSSGGLVYPTIARQLLPKIGFPWTVRIMAFIMLGLGACYCSLLKPRLPPRRSGPFLELSAFREPEYSLFILAVFLISLGQYFAFYYISSFAVEVLHLSYSTSINVLLVLNGVGILGRLIPSYFADKHFGAFNVLINACVISTIVLYFWPLVKSEGGLYAWAITYGFFVAGFQGTFPAVMTNLTKDMSKVGTRNGQGFTVVGLGMFIGPPIAGALVQSSGGSYLTAQMFAASTVLAGTLILLVARCKITGLKFKVRV